MKREKTEIFGRQVMEEWQRHQQRIHQAACDMVAARRFAQEHREIMPEAAEFDPEKMELCLLIEASTELKEELCQGGGSEPPGSGESSPVEVNNSIENGEMFVDNVEGDVVGNNKM